MPSPLTHLYYPPPSPAARGQLKHLYERKIAFGIQMRGDDDALPVLIYYGAPYALIRDVMTSISQALGTLIAGYVIHQEHSCRYRNGRAYRRISIELHGICEQYISLRDIILIINHRMQSLCWCTIREFPLRRLLNL